jgi:hypothetical protein
MQGLRYLGRYTHRVAISNHRWLAFEQEHVTFRWKDYAHGGKQGKMTLGAAEFLRRFFLHVLPKGFVRIRHFGSRQSLAGFPPGVGPTTTRLQVAFQSFAKGLAEAFPIKASRLHGNYRLPFSRLPIQPCLS